jgi:lipoprotein YgeR
MNRRTTIVLLLLLSLAPAVWGEQGEYIIKKGDTLSRVSRQSGVPVAVLQAVNRLDNASALSIGTRLKIPAVHVVRKGDTLYSLSRRYGVSVADLRAINRLSTNQALKINQKLYYVSAVDMAAAVTAPPTTPVPRKNDPPPDAKSAVFWPHPGTREVYNGKFRAIVINGDRGDLIYSVSMGQVIAAGPYRGFGNVVFVSSGTDLIYGYLGIEELIVSVGEQIESGSVLGRMGVYFHQTDAKLLFIVYDNAKQAFLDPKQVLFASTQAKE